MKAAIADTNPHTHTHIYIFLRGVLAYHHEENLTVNILKRRKFCLVLRSKKVKVEKREKSVLD
jgi:hypothetical protein